MGLVRLTRPERDKVHCIEHCSEHARDVGCSSRDRDAENNEEGHCASDDKHDECRTRQIRLSQEPTREDDGKNRCRGWWDVKQLVSGQSRIPKTRGYRGKLPAEPIAAEIHQHLRRTERVSFPVFERGDDLFPSEGCVFGTGCVFRQSKVEVLLLAWRQPGGRPRGLWVVWEDDVDDHPEEDGEEAFQQIYPALSQYW